MEQALNHFDENGNAYMVDVSAKQPTKRIATAFGRIRMNREAFTALREGNVKKGDVLGVSRVAGILAVKKTPDLIPLSHPLPIDTVRIDFALDETGLAVEATCTVQTHGVTGVEMEALAGVSVALLTIYDMCKALDKGMEIETIHLVAKQGGKSGDYVRQ